MRNVTQLGQILTLTASRAVTAGQGMLRGNTFGVALSDTANGAAGEFALNGVFTLPKATGAISEGVLVYWDNTAFNVTTTASGNTKIGVCASVGGVLSAATAVDVRLIPTI
jgi:predicted RecA/RadA family phage recombinase